MWCRTVKQEVVEVKRLQYLGSVEQLAYARQSILAEGPGRGNRIIDVCNGSGLHFTIHPDRGMDIVEAEFNGIPIAYRSCCGARSRLEYQPNGFEWLRNWQGGLLTTCGLRNAGVPNGEFGLHGRISNTAAEDVGIVREWENGEYRITVRGVLRETKMFGENLRMIRTISTALGDNRIQIRDEIVNLANSPDYLQIVYHCNFGYPLVAPGVQLEAEPHSVKPRDADAEAGVTEWDSMPEPEFEYKEQCFFHELPGDIARISLVQPALGIRISVEYATAELPRLVEWKLAAKGNYVIGLEPTNTGLMGRTQEIAEGTARHLESGEQVINHVDIVFES